MKGRLTTIATMDSTSSTELDLTGSSACATCSRVLDERRSFAVRGALGFQIKCTRCSLIDRALVVRSSKVAAVVGTALVFLNQGDQLFSGTFPWSSSWYKIPLTYMVPFCVATYGALSNGYRGSVG